VNRRTSAGLFRVLGVSPQIGAGFPDDGHLFARDAQIVIGDKIARTRYSADPGIIGKRSR
jgi:hypothetical protein